LGCQIAVPEKKKTPNSSSTFEFTPMNIQRREKKRTNFTLTLFFIDGKIGFNARNRKVPRETEYSESPKV